eukprot:1783618-Karenia_brevis.AAC.1
MERFGGSWYETRDNPTGYTFCAPKEEYVNTKFSWGMSLNESEKIVIFNPFGLGVIMRSGQGEWYKVLGM